MADAIRAMFRESLPNYRYELIFIDNDSADSTRDLIRGLCQSDPDIKGIFNAKNFGRFKTLFSVFLSLNMIE